MTYILCLETSTDVCSVALHADNRLVDTREVHEPQAHAARLVLLVEEVLRESGVKADHL